MSLVRAFLRTLPLSALVVTQVVLSPPAYAAPGDLDATFGTGGKVTTDFGGFEQANAAALQADGKIITVGTSFLGGRSFFALARYNPDGTLDSSFGSGGKVTTDFGGGFSRSEDVALQPDGKILAAGVMFTGDFTSDFALARYNPNGTLDSSFGSGGKVTTDFGSGRSFANAVALQPDGKIVAAGATLVSGVGNEWSLARYNGDGSLDSSFGTGGLVITNISLEVLDLALQPDGKIVGAGRDGNFALARYNPDGSLDSSFGLGGKVSTDWGGDDAIFSVALQPDGKIVAAGDSLTSRADFVLARYSPGGSLDSSFGAGGKVTTDFGGVGGRANAVILQPDGKIVAAGLSAYATNPAAFALARYNTDGSLDSSFGTGGKVTTSFGGLYGDLANALVLQPDGKIVAAGTDEATSWDFALARYLGGLAATKVSVDIKPGSSRNPIKLSAVGLVPVGILTTNSLDATTIDPSTVCFGDDDHAVQRDCTEAHGMGHIEDLNGDGRSDQLLHYEVGQTGIDRGDTQACLTGRTFSGLSIEGCDSIEAL